MHAPTITAFPRRHWLVPVTLALGLICSATQAAPFRLISSTADAGGSHSQGTRFAVEGTGGQPDTGRLQGQRFTLQGGFWPTAADAPNSDTLFRDSFED
jgi:hypothetical protein